MSNSSAISPRLGRRASGASGRSRLSNIQESGFLPRVRLAGYSSLWFYPRPLLTLAFYPRPLESQRPILSLRSSPSSQSFSTRPDFSTVGFPGSKQLLSSKPQALGLPTPPCLTLLPLCKTRLSLEFTAHIWAHVKSRAWVLSQTESKFYQPEEGGLFCGLGQPPGTAHRKCSCADLVVRRRSYNGLDSS